MKQLNRVQKNNDTKTYAQDMFGFSCSKFAETSEYPCLNLLNEDDNKEYKSGRLRC